MRNAMNKDFFREIKYTLNRYVSILLIVALGVAFLAGIRATCPDMKLSLDYYLDQSDFMDLRVLSTLGLTDDDLQAISSIEGVKAIEGAYSYDAEVIGENAKWILRFLSEPQNVNRISLVEGRDIENPDECIVDRLMIDKDGYQIGDQLTVTAAGKDENVSDTLSVTTFTIVGAAASPSYFTSARDTTSIGTGQTDAFVYLSPEVFKSEAYRAAYLTVEGAAEKTAYSDAYDNVVDQVKDKLEAISEEREAARYNGIMDDANTELDDARSKLADAKADAESELSDAWAKLQDGEQQIRDGQKTLDDNKAAYEEQITSAKAKLQNSEQQLQEGEAQVSANEKKLKDGRQQLSEARQQLEESGRTLEAKKQQYEEGLKAAEDGQKQLDEGRAQLAAASESLKSQEEALNTQKNALQEQYETLLVQKEELDEGIIQLERQIGELCQQRDEAAAAEEPDEELIAQLDAQIAEVSGQKSQLESRRDEIQAGLSQIESGLTQVEAGKEELSQQQDKLESQQTQLDETKKQLDDAGKQLEAGSSQLEAGKQQLNNKQQELENGQNALKQAKRQLENGWSELESGRKELQSKMASAQSQFEEAEQKLTEAKAELADAKEKYVSGKEEAKEKIADAEQEIADAEEQLGEVEYPEWYVLDRNATQSYVEYEQNAERIGAIGKIFPLIFFLVAALVSLTTMTRMVESQRTQIGTLKALGYSGWSIASKYVWYALSASVIGSVIGLIFGQKFLPWVIITAYRVLYPNITVILTPLNLYYSVTASGAAILCVTGAALASCCRELAASPAELMRPEAPAAGKKILLEHVGPVWKHMKFTSKVAMRNLFRYKKRFFMTIFGIGGCTALVVFAFGLTDSISGVAHRQYDELFHYDMTLTLEDHVTDQEMEKLYDFLENNDGLKAEQYIRLRSMSMSVQGSTTSYTAYLTVPEDSGKYGSFVELQDRKTGVPYCLNDTDVIITEKLAELLGIKAGDTLKITDKDMEREVTVGAVAENYLMSYVYMSPALYRQTFGQTPEWNKMEAFIPGLNSDNSDDYSAQLLQLEAVSGTSTTDYVRSKFEEVLDSLGIVTLILMTAAGMLAFIVLYNLNNINITERRRELATIKVLGFYDLEVAEYVYRENVMLTAIGALCGAVLGKYLHAFIITSVETDVIMFIRRADFSSYVYAVVITFGFSIFVNWLMYFRLRKIDMVESLKSVE